MCNKNEAMTILGEVFERSKELFGSKLADCYLYGSYARGDYDEESDVNILLTVDCGDDDLRAYYDSIAEIDSDISLDHNVTVFITAEPLERFNRYADTYPFYRDVIREGIRYA